MWYFLQSAAYVGRESPVTAGFALVHNATALMTPFAMTVDCTNAGVSHVAFKRTEGTLRFDTGSVVVPFASPIGGVLPSRRYRANEAAA
jgi:hypothetical protein